MAPEAVIRHQMRGRLRVRIPEKRKDRDFFSELDRRLSECPQVAAVETNSLTGSVLVFYEGDAAAVRDYAESRNLFRIAEKAAGPPPAGRAGRGLKSLDERIKESTGGAWDGRSAAFIALLSFAGIQILRGNFLPAAGSLIWYAAGLARSAMPRGGRG